jgi:glutamine synthetase
LVVKFRATFIPLGILSKEGWSRAIMCGSALKDVLIEMHAREDRHAQQAAYEYLGSLASSAAQAKVAGIKEIPHVERANEVGALARQLKAKRELMHKLVGKAETMHDDPAACAALLTSDGAARMAEVRAASDALELLVGDEYWPLPKYREMLFPV